jgi:hypothetical protein
MHDAVQLPFHPVDGYNSAFRHKNLPVNTPTSTAVLAFVRRSNICSTGMLSGGEHIPHLSIVIVFCSITAQNMKQKRDAVSCESVQDATSCDNQLDDTLSDKSAWYLVICAN